MENLDAAVEACAQITVSATETFNSTNAVETFLETLNMVVNSETTQNAVGLHKELMEMLQSAITKSEELTGCLATFRDA